MLLSIGKIQWTKVLNRDHFVGLHDMVITKVQVYPGNDYPDKSGYKLIAYAAVVFDSEIVVSHIRVVENPQGNRKVFMPSVKTRTGRYQDVAYSLTERSRERVREQVLEAVERGDWSEPIGGTDAE